MTWRRVSLESVRALLDFAGGRDDDPAWQEVAQRQLTGTVALFNRLTEHPVAWLADEVGMGKTYVALGVMALLRHLSPDSRVLILVPSSRLQPKWLNEYHRFCTRVFQCRDHRVRTFHGPARRLGAPRNLREFATRVVANPDQDLLVPLSAFSFPLGSEPEAWQEAWRGLRSIAPAVPEPPPAPLRDEDKWRFKRHYAASLNAVLPDYDLVIVDESHHLKHGLNSTAARNQTLALALGGQNRIDETIDRTCESRVGRLLCLSATPVEADYAELVRQARVFGLGDIKGFDVLADSNEGEERRRDVARQFVIRRLNRMQVDDRQLTKNLYRREWRRGGVDEHGEPMGLSSDREQLIVALIQKKVIEILHRSGKRRSDGSFLRSFQMGMLSSFESFLETVQSRSDQPIYEGDEQTREEAEQRGLDTSTIDGIANRFRRRFATGLPHPKMDRVAAALAGWMFRGEKSLVFVRRVRTVEELAAKVAREYDRRLKKTLQNALATQLEAQLSERFERYERRHRTRRSDRLPLAESGDDADDQGGYDTFFSWFFRGSGDDNMRAGAYFRKQHIQSPNRRWSTLFNDNHVLALLGGEERVRAWATRHREALGELARHYFHPGSDRTEAWGYRFEAWQAAALEHLAERPAPNVNTDEAKLLRQKLYPVRREAPVEGHIGEPEELLAESTLFTALRHRGDLQERLWPFQTEGPLLERIRDREVRRELLASVLRLGHPTMDLWLAAVEVTGDFVGRAGDLRPGTLAEAFLDRLESQREMGSVLSSWTELQRLGQNHQLVLNTNFPKVEEASLHQLPRHFQTKLSRQSPVVGMHGGRKSTQALYQFRMPGYPYVVVGTDILKEGIDLHTFCARVVHYGIASTSSATEQRTGRVDRINSLVQRRLQAPDADDDMLQVHYPHLIDTVEPLQLRVLYERMDRFLKLLHEGLGTREEEDSRIQIDQGIYESLTYPRPVERELESAFGVREDDVAGAPLPALPETPTVDMSDLRRKLDDLAGEFDIEIEGEEPAGVIVGEAWLSSQELVKGEHELGDRRQPFGVSLEPRQDGSGLRIRLVSLVGTIDPSSIEGLRHLLAFQRRHRGIALMYTDDQARAVAVRYDLLLDGDEIRYDKMRDALQRTLAAAEKLEKDMLDGRNLSMHELRPALEALP